MKNPEWRRRHDLVCQLSNAQAELEQAMKHASDQVYEFSLTELGLEWDKLQDQFPKACQQSRFPIPVTCAHWILGSALEIQKEATVLANKMYPDFCGELKGNVFQKHETLLKFRVLQHRFGTAWTSPEDQFGRHQLKNRFIEEMQFFNNKVLTQRFLMHFEALERGLEKKISEAKYGFDLGYIYDVTCSRCSCYQEHPMDKTVSEIAPFFSSDLIVPFLLFVFWTSFFRTLANKNY